MMITEILGNNVRLLMMLFADNQTRLAPALHITQGQLSRKLAGETQWSWMDCNRLCERYQITPAILFGMTTDVYQATESRRRAMVADGTLSARF